MVQSATRLGSSRSTSISLSISQTADLLNHAHNSLNASTISCAPPPSASASGDDSDDSIRMTSAEEDQTGAMHSASALADIGEEDDDYAHDGTFERDPFIFDARERVWPGSQDYARHRDNDASAAAASKRKRAKRVVQMASVVVALALGYLAGYHRTSPTGTSSTADSLASGTCPDPYAQPGYLLYKENKKVAQWIPYTDANVWDENLRAAQQSKDFGFPTKRRPYEVPDDIITTSAPSSLALALRNKATRASDASLGFLRGKKVVVLGSSLDRNALTSFCFVHGGHWTENQGARGLFKCGFPELDDFSVTFAFTFGTLEMDDDLRASFVGPPPYKFESRIEQLYLPALKTLGDMPDMIIWASGTWDILGFRKKLRGANPSAWKEEPMSWDELSWHRQRLNEIHSYITTTFPGVPLMYRPPTYLKAMGASSNSFLAGINDQNVQIVNAGVYAFRESAKAAMSRLEVPLFRWAEKLVGSSQYEDPVHFRKGTGTDFLYGELLLYYLRYYTSPDPAERTHCLDHPTV